MPTSDPLIHTKLCLPFVRPNLVARPRLQEKLLQGLRCPLTLFVAPPGFGKTTLVASCVSGQGMPVAWLSLDKNDNQAERFLEYLIAALHAVDKTIGTEAALLLAEMHQVSSEGILTFLINDLDRQGRELILVLDDYQFIDQQAVHQATAFLLEHCPGTLHLVIATRSDPPLPIARLRARGQTVELRAADLRFTETEAAQFLNDVMGLRLDAHSVAVLEDRTEGWVAGLQMAALSMRDLEDVSGFIAGFSGTNRYILDYLLEEVLARQSLEIQQFLLCTSILERLTAPLCEAVLGACHLEGWTADPSSTLFSPSNGIHCRQILEYLDQVNLFLVPLDEERKWYRYHHLFADLLRTQLQKFLHEEGVVRLHLCASEWFEHHGSTLDAIHHASLASDFERIERLIEQNYTEMLNRGEMSGILRFWMGKLSSDIVYRRPWLCLYQAFSRSWFGQLEEATLLLREAAKLIQSDVSATDTKAMLGYHSYVQSRVTAMQGDTRRAIEFCLAARDNIPADNLGLQIEVGITLGYEYFLVGDLASANETLHEMIRICETVGAINNPVAAYALLARTYELQGRLHDSYELFQKAAGLAYEAGRQYLGAVGLVEIGIAALLCEWNDLETALARLKRGLDALPSWGKTDDFVLAYITLYRVHLALGNQTEAAGAIEKAAQLIQTCGVFSEARSAGEAGQVEMWLLQGDRLAIDRWFARHEQRSGSPDLFRYENELTHLAQARVFIAQQQLGEAVGLLSCLEESARSGGRRGRLIEILILKALALQEAGEPEQALIALTKSLTLAMPHGYVRIFLDEGLPIKRLLTQWLAHSRAGPNHEYVHRLLTQFDSEPVWATESQKQGSKTNVHSVHQRHSGEILVEPLTPRELDVLHLISAGKTNQEIARQLVVAPGTVKAHTASIYRKLNVTNRTEAAARARELGILP